MNTQKLVNYAVAVCEDYRDDCGEINLTGLEEAVLCHFELDDAEFEGNDVSFLVFKELERKRLL